MMQRLKKTAALAVTLALSLLALATPALAAKAQLPELPKGQCVAVSYTHLTLPTILRV